MAILVFGIPSCGSCKKARAWLDTRGVAYRFVDLRSEPPARARVLRWAEALTARALRNTSGGSYRALGPEKDAWSDARWVEAFTADPMLVRRPVLEIDDTPAAVGFDAARWATIV